LRLNGDASKRPVGSGPFIFERFEPGVSITARRNPTYYRAPEPHVDEVVMHIVPDVATQLAGLGVEVAPKVWLDG
jgi:peptide/nickel transport system substrate-binding protein